MDLRTEVLDRRRGVAGVAEGASAFVDGPGTDAAAALLADAAATHAPAAGSVAPR